MEQSGSVDPYRLLRLLEDLTDKHARTVRALDRVLSRLRKDIENQELQSLALTYLRRLRVMRRRLLRALEGSIDFDYAEEEVRSNVATLSEYMIIVGYIYEEEVLRKMRILAKRGAVMLQGENFDEDVEQIVVISKKLQKIVDKYY